MGDWLGAALAGGSERVSWLVGEAESDDKANSGGDLAGNAYSRSKTAHGVSVG